MTLDTLFTNEQFALIVSSILVAGIILYMCTGFIFISKSRVGIIERMGKYVGTYGHKLYYFAPLIYRRVGYYKLGVISQKIVIDKQKYIVKYEITNFKQFHYVANHDVYGLVKASLFEKNNDLSKVLIDRFKLSGAKFISLQLIKKTSH